MTQTETRTGIVALARRDAGAVLAGAALLLAGPPALGAGGAAPRSRPPSPSAPLEGTAWYARSYKDGAGVIVPVLPGSEVTARFADGRVAGSAGCNSYSATYRRDGGGIAMGLPVSTRRACSDPAGVMEQEAAYLTAIQTAREYRVEGDRLSLETDVGALAVTFTTRAS